MCGGPRGWQRHLQGKLNNVSQVRRHLNALAINTNTNTNTTQTPKTKPTPTTTATSTPTPHKHQHHLQHQYHTNTNINANTNAKINTKQTPTLNTTLLKSTCLGNTIKPSKMV
jgi:hypothetical protein